MALEFKAKPEDFGFTQEQAEALYDAYVTQELTIPQACKAASKKLECPIPERRAALFLRRNGLTRSISYYAKRNPFHGLARADAEKAKAIVKARGGWVD
ncbi:MAG: hypothetical protein AMK75_02640 [Planctomycetes bacterium SM23_65]|nr:MAG: hypothetical protein AMK75_02640 [Planctomycetes bacterium SM23_65]